MGLGKLLLNEIPGVLVFYNGYRVSEITKKQQEIDRIRSGGEGYTSKSYGLKNLFMMFAGISVEVATLFPLHLGVASNYDKLIESFSEFGSGNIAGGFQKLGETDIPGKVLGGIYLTGRALGYRMLEKKIDYDLKEKEMELNSL